MRVYRDRIEVTRGESFNYNVKIVNNDGSPYVISNMLRNPYFLLTVASTKYAEHDRYLHNYWCKIDNSYRRFYCTTPIELADETQAPENALNALELTDYVKYIQQGGTAETYSVYKINDEYKYWDGEAYQFYELSFTITFLPVDTINWVEQEYEFGMKLIDGNEAYVKNDKRPLRNYNYMQKINVPSKIIVTSNISGTMDALEVIYE